MSSREYYIEMVNIKILSLANRGYFAKALRLENLLCQWSIALAKLKLENLQKAQICEKIYVV